MARAIDKAWDLLARIPSRVVLVIAASALAGTVIALAILIPLSGQVAAQADAGARARVTQCRVWPVAVKMYTAGERAGWISEHDLKVYRSALHCSK